MHPPERSLQEKVAVITGAGRGLGLAIAEACAREGAAVIIAELISERGASAAERLQSAGYRAEAVRLDVTDATSCAGLCTYVMQHYGCIDVLVNNAGLFIGNTAEETLEADWRLQLDVMLTGPFLCSQAVARAAMIPQRRGAIVNIASIVGTGGWPLRHGYNAAKAGLVSLTQGLAVEWAQYNIRVNAVSPAPIMTEMFQEALDAGLAALDRYLLRTPMGRIGEAREVADAVLFLASEQSAAVTGCNLFVDGGWIPYGNPNAVGYPE